MLAYFLHDLDPYVFRIHGNIGPRWYGLAYVLGFVAAWWLIRWLSRKGYSELKPSQVGDFIVYGALFGVMLGGRLGYMLLYNREAFFSNPLSFFNILGGGMASHGGIIGLTLFAWVYARIHKISWAGLGDNLVIAAPIGVCFGRLANFINGELWGRPGTVPWAVQFPTELREGAVLLWQKTLAALPPDFLAQMPASQPEGTESVIAAAKTNPAVAEALRATLPPRHPSQLYEALLEGALLFAILLAVRLRFKELRQGVITGLFFILYALLRIFGELFREIDAGQNPILGLNPGQFYSLFFIAIGIAFLAWTATRPHPSLQKPAAK